MKLDVLNINGTSTGRSIELPEEVFGIKPNEHSVYLAVKLYLANQRQGTHKSKERWELSGSTRKLHKQKGTGGSRKGDINSPLFHGGARVFGPRPRDYWFKLNTKVSQLARRSALSSKLAEGAIIVVEDFTLSAPNTKDYINILNNLNATGEKALLVLPDIDRNLFLSSRNVPKASVARAQDLNTYQIMNSNKIMLSESTIKLIKETLEA